MKIFFDTTPFFEDPLLGGNHISILLEMSKENYVELYISKIVSEELKRHYIDRVTKTISESNKSIRNLRKYKIVDINYIDKKEKTDSLKTIDNRFNEIISTYKVKMVKYRNDILPEILNVYFTGKKPFAKGRDSFKDAIIWFSYLDIFEKNKSDDLIFISNNTSDFSNKEKNGIHKDLKPADINIEYYTNLYTLFKQSTKFKDIHNQYESEKLNTRN